MRCFQEKQNTGKGKLQQEETIRRQLPPPKSFVSI